MTRQVPAVDPNYRVENLPAPIKAKVTEFADASMEYAFKGTATEVEEHEAIEEHYHIARYNLERTILTYIEREARKPRRKK